MFMAGAAMWLAATTVLAQPDLGAYGQTELQKATGDAVQSTCIGFIQAGEDDFSTPLFATCTAMVATSVELDTGQSNPESLGLNEDQLAASLQQIATEEFASTQSMAAEISNNRVDPMLTRLAAIRGGATGFNVSGFQPYSDSELLADGSWQDGAMPNRGGSAGDDGVGSALGGFANISYGTGTRDGTDRTNEFDFDGYSLTFGLDYRFENGVIFGGALSYYDLQSEFDERPTVAGGDSDADGFGGFIYTTWYSGNFYVDGLAGYAVSNYDLRRNIVIPNANDPTQSITETAKASPDSKDLSFSIGAGYNWNLGSFNINPYGRLNYLSVDIDSYREKGAEASGLNLEVDGQDWKSFTSALGAQFNYTISTDTGVIIPQLKLGWVHQFEDDAIRFNAVYVDDPRNDDPTHRLRAATDDPDSDYFEFGLAISGVFRGGAQVFLSYDTLLGFEDLSSHLFTLGGRWEF
jgi:outer membrane autotransporter protein